MIPAPVTHVAEADKLTADALVDLYEITLKGSPTVYRFKNNNTVTWRGNIYEGIACQLIGDQRTSDGQESRPTLQIVNPVGIFNVPALNHQLDWAVVIRKRVLLGHLTSNTNIFDQRMWYIGRVLELISGQSISFELRNMTEGQNFQIPVRQYIPPEFPLVTL